MVVVPWASLEYPIRIAITVVLSVLFLLISRTPLYGIDTKLNWNFDEFASVPGTSLQLGLAPVLALELLMPFTDGNMCSFEQEIPLSIAISALMSVSSGLYYMLNNGITVGAFLLLSIQLFAGALVLVMMHELFRKEYAALSEGSLVWFPALRLCDRLVTELNITDGVQVGATLAMACMAHRCLSCLPRGTSVWKTPLQGLAVVGWALGWWSPGQGFQQWILASLAYGFALRLWHKITEIESSAADTVLGWAIGMLTMACFATRCAATPTSWILLFHAYYEFKGYLHSYRMVKKAYSKVPPQCPVCYKQI